MFDSEKINAFFEARKDDELKRIRDTKENVDPGFNLFTLISDLYYRENMHSDIIKELLDPIGKHGEGNRFLMLFIEFLNKQNKTSKIEHTHYYGTVTVVREQARIDICIKSGKHAIIIENKINDAGDTVNQIPTYYEVLKKENFIIDAVVYLTLCQTKEPDKSTWGDYNKEIDKKLISVRAYEGMSTDLCNGWLRRCIEKTSHIDNLSILRQYLKTIKYLTRNHLDLDYMNEFKNFLVANKKKNYTEIAKSIKKSVDDYPQFTCKNLLDYFKKENNYMPFESVRPLGDISFYFNRFVIGEYVFNMDVNLNIDFFTIDFSVREPNVWTKLEPESLLKILKYDDKFELWYDGRFRYTYSGDFIEFEDKAIEFLTGFLIALDQNTAEIDTALDKLKQE